MKRSADTPPPPPAGSSSVAAMLAKKLRSMDDSSLNQILSQAAGGSELRQPPNRPPPPPPVGGPPPKFRQRNPAGTCIGGGGEEMGGGGMGGAFLHGMNNGMGGGNSIGMGLGMCRFGMGGAMGTMPGMSTMRDPRLPPNARPGDWICNACNNHNYADKINCNRCKIPKAMQAGVGAPGMPGMWMGPNMGMGIPSAMTPGMGMPPAMAPGMGMPPTMAHGMGMSPAIAPGMGFGMASGPGLGMGMGAGLGVMAGKAAGGMTGAGGGADPLSMVLTFLQNYPPIFMGLSNNMMMQNAIMMRLQAGGRGAAEEIIAAVERGGNAGGVRGAEAALLKLLSGGGSGLEGGGGGAHEKGQDNNPPHTTERRAKPDSGAESSLTETQVLSSSPATSALSKRPGENDGSTMCAVASVAAGPPKGPTIALPGNEKGAEPSCQAESTAEAKQGDTSAVSSIGGRDAPMVAPNQEANVAKETAQDPPTMASRQCTAASIAEPDMGLPRRCEFYSTAYGAGETDLDVRSDARRSHFSACVSGDKVPRKSESEGPRPLAPTVDAADQAQALKGGLLDDAITAVAGSSATAQDALQSSNLESSLPCTVMSEAVDGPSSCATNTRDLTKPSALCTDSVSNVTYQRPLASSPHSTTTCESREPPQSEAACEGHGEVDVADATKSGLPSGDPPHSACTDSCTSTMPTIPDSRGASTPCVCTLPASHPYPEPQCDAVVDPRAAFAPTASADLRCAMGADASSACSSCGLPRPLCVNPRCATVAEPCAAITAPLLSDPCCSPAADPPDTSGTPAFADPCCTYASDPHAAFTTPSLADPRCADGPRATCGTPVFPDPRCAPVGPAPDLRAKASFADPRCVSAADPRAGSAANALGDPRCASAANPRAAFTAYADPSCASAADPRAACAPIADPRCISTNDPRAPNATLAFADPRCASNADPRSASTAAPRDACSSPTFNNPRCTSATDLRTACSTPAFADPCRASCVDPRASSAPSFGDPRCVSGADSRHARSVEAFSSATNPRIGGGISGSCGFSHVAGPGGLGSGLVGGLGSGLVGGLTGSIGDPRLSAAGVVTAGGSHGDRSDPRINTMHSAALRADDPRNSMALGHNGRPGQSNLNEPRLGLGSMGAAGRAGQRNVNEPRLGLGSMGASGAPATGSCPSPCGGLGESFPRGPGLATAYQCPLTGLNSSDPGATCAPNIAGGRGINEAHGMESSHGIGIHRGTGGGLGMGGATTAGGRQGIGAPNGGLSGVSGSEPLSRAIHVRGMPPHTTPEELVNELGPFGALESVRLNPERQEALVAFVSAHDAGALLASTSNIRLHDTTLELSWGKAPPIPPQVLDAINTGATRNLYLGNLPPGTDVHHLNAAFSPFGPIESIRVMRNTSTGYVNFCNVEAAMAAKARFDHAGGAKASDFLVTLMAGTPEALAPVQMSFTSAQQLARGRRQAAGGVTNVAGGASGIRDGLAGRTGGATSGAASLKSSRSVYVGNLPSGCSMSELAALGAPHGPLESLRMMGGASYGFLNFVHERDAHSFWMTGQTNPPTLRSNRLFLNWAKAPPLDPAVRRLVEEQGATRHLRVANIAESTSSEQLSSLFRQFGEVESVQLKPAEGAAQVNLTSITAAAAARDQLNGLRLGDWELVVGYV